MGSRHRLTIWSSGPDPRAASLLASARQLGLIASVDSATALRVADVVFIDAPIDEAERQRLTDVLVDPLLQVGSWDLPAGAAIEITTHAGVTNPAADALRHACEVLGIDVSHAATARRIEFDDRIAPHEAEHIVARIAANPIVERWATGTIEPAGSDLGETAPSTSTEPVDIDIASMDDGALDLLNDERSMYLDDAELRTIRDHYIALGRCATDVELETLAQTWSEHCSHKTFRAAISMDRDGTGDPSMVEPLLAMLRRSTDEIAAPFVRSAFVGNAGVIEFIDGVTYALKAETHNHPSAVEPFGGANTGVGGVIRDVLGIAHRPIAVTDVLCFGPADLALDDLPAGTIHPSRMRDGVIDGVADYGNKIGLPTVAGAILYDDAYTTNPLVFAGCVGMATSWRLHDGPFIGDRVLLLGGATGRDGVRGATFSSATMDATTGEVAGASVQIGDPIVEKLLIDALVGAEDLYTSITDCGAGGLSSAVGEMAETLGADIQLDDVPRKYPGLQAWEVWLSEAQERMVVSVDPVHVDALVARCARVGVVAADIGVFTGDGVLTVRSGRDVVARLDTGFMHDGRPQRRMIAEVARTARVGATRRVDHRAQVLLGLLGHPNLASKASTIRRYDHEIRGTSVVRPLVGAAADGPADGVVLAEPMARSGIAIGIGVNPWFGLHDPERMAHAVVDEAIRNVVAVGADPDRVALLDNFSWGDPTRPSTLGDLVAAVEGCCDAARTHRAPFVSGKDSLNNEYTGSDGQRHAVPPTLVITAVAHVPDADRCVTPDLKEVGNILVLLGSTLVEFAGSHLDMVLADQTLPGQTLPDQITNGAVPGPDPDAPDRYRNLHRAIRGGLVRSCHDLSEGGLALAIAEMCLAGRLAATVHTLGHDDPVAALFSESIGRFVVEVSPGDLATFQHTMAGDALVIGEVTGGDVLRIEGVDDLTIDDLVAAHRGRT